MNESGGVVQIYTDQGLVRTVSVPRSGEGDYWDVCVVDGLTGRISLINEMSAVCPAGEGIGLASAGRPGAVSPLVALASPLSVGLAGTAGRDAGAPSATGAEGQRYRWEFGDGQESGEENPEHVYAGAGIYTVSLEVSATGGETHREVKGDYIRVENGAPELRINRLGSTMQIGWESGGGGFALESKTMLGVGDWVAVTQPPVVNGNSNSVTVPMKSHEFFRLRKP